MRSVTTALLLSLSSWRTTTTVRGFAATLRSSSIAADVAERMEATVRRYFQGVHTKDADMIRSCFGDTATIRDVCSLINNQQRTVPAETLVERCLEFCAAHPDVAIDFYYGPECSRTTGWVVAHWYEVGTWSGASCGLTPQNTPMACEGQTRFRLEPDKDDYKIVEFVVTRTFTDWEKALMEQQQQP